MRKPTEQEVIDHDLDPDKLIDGTTVSHVSKNVSQHIRHLSLAVADLRRAECCCVQLQHGEYLERVRDHLTFALSVTAQNNWMSPEGLVSALNFVDEMIPPTSDSPSILENVRIRLEIAIKEQTEWICGDILFGRHS